MKITAGDMHFQKLNDLIRESADTDITVDHCIGQRFLCSGMSGKTVTINGTPGNALASYLDGCRIVVNGNAQDATGDTMNDGSIIIHGSAGDATGYAMRGGLILVEGNTGYRAGIHMKAYGAKVPTIVIGGKAGSFLGEYQAGGTIIVLGLGYESEVIVGNFCGTGQHGGKIVLRSDFLPPDLSDKVTSRDASEEDMAELLPFLQCFCASFGKNLDEVVNHHYYILTADTKNPYKQLYTYN